MIALQIDSIKTFMNKLLLQNTFDAFLVSEASITTFATFTIDGQNHPEFYAGDATAGSDTESSGADTAGSGVPQTQISWEQAKPFCLQVIKGKRLPLSFHIVLQLSKEKIHALITEHGINLDPEDVFGLFLNIQYRSELLTVTTGSSLRVFSMDKSLDHAWDEEVQKFLKTEELLS